jgi:sortase A
MRIVIASTPMARILRWTERGLLGCAFVLLGYAGYTMAASWIFEHQANRDLDHLLQESQSGVVTPESAAPIENFGLVGRIDVDRLGVSVVVLEGADEPVLARAAGHIAGTALPGEPGNVGIAGHRDTFFRPLKDIRRNDIIRVTTPAGEYRYRVVSTRVVDPDHVSVLDSDGSDSLTLVTCYPFYFVGSAPHRFIVRAERIPESGGGHPVAALQPHSAAPHPIL